MALCALLGLRTFTRSSLLKSYIMPANFDLVGLCGLVTALTKGLVRLGPQFAGFDKDQSGQFSL